MKLWLLKPREELHELERHPWSPWYDKCFGMIVRAADEEAAREVAQSNAKEEKDWMPGIFPWRDHNYSTCEVLEASGEAGVILMDVKLA